MEGDICVSCRLHNRIYDVDYPSGEVVWIMGDDGDFGEGMFHHSHDAQVTYDTDEAGNRTLTRILLYDNREAELLGGAAPCPPDESCPDDIEPYSRVIEVTVDEDLNAEIVWKWPSPTSDDFDDVALYSPLAGGIDRLPNGNLLVTHATVGGNPYLGVISHGRLTELKRDGSLTGAEVVWDVEFNAAYGSFRALRIPEEAVENWKPRPIDMSAIPQGPSTRCLGRR